MNCPGSVRLIAALPDEERSSAYADEGTALHELAAQLLERGVFDASHLLDTDFFSEDVQDTYELTEERIEVLNTYLHWVEAQPGEYVVEQRVDLSHVLGPDQGGTADCIMYYTTTKTMTVADLKGGRGVEVSCYQNEQPLLYALGALKRYEDVWQIEHVRLVIIQPRLDHIDEWTIPVAELLAFGDRARAAAEATRDPEAPFVPSEDACRWCRGKAVCPSAARHAIEGLPAIAEDFPSLDIVDIPSPEMLSPVVIAAVVERADFILDWIKAVKEEALKRLKEGHDIPGYKLVSGRQGNRKWSDERAVEHYLRKTLRLSMDKVLTKKLKSPTQLEKMKLFGPTQMKRLNEWTVREDGAPALALMSDPRPVLNLAARADEFEAISN
jgi:hypothetical protein